MPLTTAAQAIKSGLPRIGCFQNSDLIVVKASITLEIKNLLDFLNIGKVMNDSQIAQTIEMILVCYPDLNLADLKLFFFWLKKGDYGKFYDRLDGSIILESLESYHQQRIIEMENIHTEVKHSNNKTFHPSVVEAMSKSVKEFQGKKSKEHAGTPKRTPSDVELFYQRALKQFDNLYTRYGQNNGLRALKIGDTVFTIDTFINKKVSNILNNGQKI